MFEALRQALYTKLNTGGLGMSVYDHVPQPRPAVPYVAIGDTTTEPFDTDTSEGLDTVTEVRVFNEYKGSKASSATVDAIRALCHHQSLTIPGFTMVSMQVLDPDITRDDASGTREGLARIRVLIDEA
jgi:hypothetical protein